MIRNPSIRRILVTLFLLVGPLTQFQTLYACELMEHDKPNMVCCCDEPSDMGMMGCELDGTCQDQPGASGDGCCDISYQPSQVTQASGASFQAQQVLLLDAPQPPPIPASFDFHEIVSVKHTVRFDPCFSPPLPNKPVYLLTNRFRI